MKNLGPVLTCTLIMPLFLAFTSPLPVHFDKAEHDFGIIAQGIPQKAVFILKNTSDQPLILKRVKGSCGCTATSHTQEPIVPGASTEIEATYNAKSIGSFTKTISVHTNLQDEPFVLTIKGTVKPAE
ncbi:MAG: DUF1573 domain-containing protein [Saprospiraceae bacterium]|nr:DUF1573 domain-containing protein [Saprospiraceae bacterium]